MLSKFKTFVWLLQQPKGVGLIWNLFLRMTLYKNLENTMDESVAWCTTKAVDTNSALRQLFPDISRNPVDLTVSFPKEFIYAKDKFESTPYEMGGAGNMNLLFNICENIKAKYVLETGVAYGWSSLSVLLSIKNIQDSLLISTDMPYPKMGNEDFVGIVIPNELKKHWRLFQESDLSGLPKAFKLVEQLDVVHYDSDKSYIGRINSYPLLYNKLRKGGIFISDDIQDNIAFKDFCEKLKITPIVISFDDKYVGAFIK
jgi:predicted O-methyltransferase YrrM